MRTHALAAWVVAACALGVGVNACSSEEQPATPDQGGAATNTTSGSDVAPSAGTTGSDTTVPATGTTGTATTGADPLPPKEPTAEEALDHLPQGADQLKVLCARGGTNRLTTALCGATPKTLGSLKDLQDALGLAFTNPAQTGRNNNGNNGNPAFTLVGHSSSLVARFTSAINPRVIVHTPDNDVSPNSDYVALGFVRGEQFAEVAARDPQKNALRFFLVAFKQGCNATGCTAGDLLTPNVEKGWTSATVYEDVDVLNTVMDCTQCHQTAGTGTAKILRFQELQNPWTHSFRNNNQGGQALLADFHAAHGTAEDYGPVPANQIDSSEPQNLENFVRAAGFAQQPNEFPTNTIEGQVRRSSPNQPQDNSTPGTSTTWQQLYDRFAAGTVIAPPYHDVKVSDPAKLQTLTAAYQQYRAGTLTAANLPDIRNVFLDSRAWAMGFAPKPSSTGKEILVQMCGSCHNSRLDQTVTRARFDVTKLETMDKGEKEKAIERMMLPPERLAHMPPARFRSLSAAEITLAVEELKK